MWVAWRPSLGRAASTLMTRLRNRVARQKPGCTALGASEFESGNGATALDRGLDDRERAAGRVARATAASRRVRLAPPMTLVSLVFSTPDVRAASGRSRLGHFRTHASQQIAPSLGWRNAMSRARSISATRPVTPSPVEDLVYRIPLRTCRKILQEGRRLPGSIPGYAKVPRAEWRF